MPIAWLGTAIACADLDGDGALDLAVADARQGDPGVVAVLLNAP